MGQSEALVKQLQWQESRGGVGGVEQVQNAFTANYNKIAADAAKDNKKWKGGDPALGYKCAAHHSNLKVSAVFHHRARDCFMFGKVPNQRRLKRSEEVLYILEETVSWMSSEL